MFSINAKKVLNDVEFQSSKGHGDDYAVNQATADRLAISLTDLQLACQELVNNAKAKHTTTGFIKRS